MVSILLTSADTCDRGNTKLVIDSTAFCIGAILKALLTTIYPWTFLDSRLISSHLI